ncbi:hypothetical protein TrCOL_g13673 [Triparma columacea]|uniref:Uncharacterized protein n=1 Tax=Triparma columacea TaxID=722753 RepID=A0A9W7L9M2_9STRA|nr:hypothetical protein TrCOL_g13673 [Triparma columacea]
MLFLILTILPGIVLGFQPTTRQELKDAINSHLSGTSDKGLINNWDTSLITDMRNLFSGYFDCGSLCSLYEQFNEDISGWETSQVTDMTRMFYQAYNFNQDISGWDTSQVTSMSYMFRSASDFNQDISAWDTSQVTSMSEMFKSASDFNQDISGWNVCACTYFSSMFYGSGYSGSSLSTTQCTGCPSGRYTEGTGEYVQGGNPCQGTFVSSRGGGPSKFVSS